MPNPEDAASSGNEDANQQAPAQDQLDRLLARMDQVDHLSARMDRMTDMFTQLMTNMALNDMRMPNIPGWPPSNRNAPDASGGSNNQANPPLVNQVPPSTGFNAAPASISQLVQHPPPNQTQQQVPTATQVGHVTPTRNSSTTGGNPPINMQASVSECPT